MFVNGVILTMDERSTVAEAVAIDQGRIVAVGMNEAMRKALPSATVADLRGRTMLPGFYAAHDHFPVSGFVGDMQVDLNSPPMGRMETIAQIVDALKAKAAKARPGEWILGRGYDDTLLSERRHPTRADLDRVSSSNPVWIVHTSGHFGVANSKALAVAGVVSDTGLIEETLDAVAKHVPDPTLEQRMQAVRRAGAEYLARGVTTTVIAHGSRERLIDLKTALAREFLPLRVVQMLSEGGTIPETAAEAVKWRSPDGRVRAGAIKIAQDGSLQGYTGWLTAPYHNRPVRGWQARPRAALVELVKKYHRGGHQIAIHGNGDAAIDDILEAFEQAQREFPRPGARHRIEHCQTAREDQLARMARLGVTPSFFVAHVYYWGDRHHELFLGPERAARISPLASAGRHGLRYTLHNDTPVTPVDPLHLIWCAVNRRTAGGAILGEAQRVSVERALRAVTIDAAWQNFEEAEKGSIEAGKAADLVVLDRNPLTAAASDLRSIRVMQTYVGGVALLGAQIVERPHLRSR